MQEDNVVITATLTPEVALQLALFCKRSTFNQFFDRTEAHLSQDERTKKAYRMIAGIEAVARALADVGYELR